MTEETIVEAGWESILLDAFALVHGDRGDTYGHPHHDYSRTTDIFNAITGRDLTVIEGVLFAKCMKLSRLGKAIQDDYPFPLVRDTITDDAGYSDCLAAAWLADDECRTPPVESDDN